MFYTRTRKLKNELTNRRGEKGPLLNLKKSCILNGLIHSRTREKKER